MKSLINYIQASRAELAKVTWPSRRQIARLSWVVIVFSLVFTAILGSIDYGFSTLLQKLILKV